MVEPGDPPTDPIDGVTRRWKMGRPMIGAAAMLVISAGGATAATFAP
jgi:hypothetical protein